MIKWQELFDERQLRLIENCKSYTEGDPAGLPGHNLILIIYKMEGMLQIQQKSLEELFQLSTRSDLTALKVGDIDGALLNEVNHLKDHVSRNT